MDGSILDLGGSHGTHGRPSPSEDGTVGVAAEGRGGEGEKGEALISHRKHWRDTCV